MEAGIGDFPAISRNVTDEHGSRSVLVWDNTSTSAMTLPLQRRRQNVILPLRGSCSIRLCNEARVLAETEIAQKNNELAIKKAELLKASDTKKVGSRRCL